MTTDAPVTPEPTAGRLLVETDSPYLSPPGGPRGRNEPASVHVTATWVAELRSASADHPDDPDDRVDLDLVAAYDTEFSRTRRT